jgi:hypothetical protein
MRRVIGFLLVLVVAMVPTSAFAQLGTVPNVFSSGTVISSAAMNANFSTAYANALNRTGGTMTGTLTTLALVPTADNASDVGSALLSYNDGWFDGTLTVATLSLTTLSCSTCVPDAALSSNVPLKNAANTFSALQTVAFATNATLLSVNNTTTTASNRGATISFLAEGVSHGSIGALGAVLGTTVKDMAYYAPSTRGHYFFANALTVESFQLNGASGLPTFKASEGNVFTMTLCADECDDLTDSWTIGVDGTNDSFTITNAQISDALVIDMSGASGVVKLGIGMSLRVEDLASSSGTRYICSTTDGTFTDSASACSGTDADLIASIPTLLARIESLEAQLKRQ